MQRREFIAIGAGSGVALLGAGAVLTDDSRSAGPDFGPVSTPASSGVTTLDNGRRASLYAGGDIAFFGASLITQHSGVPGVVGRLKNISESVFERVRIGVEFVDNSGAVLVRGAVTKEGLASGAAWQFAAFYPGDEPDRIAGASIRAIDAA